MSKREKYYYIYIICIIVLLFAIFYGSTSEGFQDNTQDNTREEIIDTFIPKTVDSPNEVSGIPLVIYRSWITNSLPIRMKNTVMKTIALTPEFDNHFFSDEDCHNFIRDNFEPNVLNAYNCLKPAAFKSDFWRCCILYKRGGVYFDIKLELHLRLYEILQKYPKIFIRDRISEPEISTPLLTDFPLWNGIMSSAPGNPVFKACIDEVIVSCKNRDYKQNMFDITGPYQLGRMVDKYEGLSFSKNLPFIHRIHRQIHYFDELFTTEYEGYRDDQKRMALVKVKHYGDLYRERDVYDESVIFL